MKCDFCRKELLAEPYIVTISRDVVFAKYSICKDCKAKIQNMTKHNKKDRGIGTAVSSGIGTAVSDRKNK